MNMSRFTSCISQASTEDWIRINQESIQDHPAWQESIDVMSAETLLEGAGSFTYLLRKGAEEYLHFITFVKEDLTIKHQWFTLEFDPRGWFYRNGGTGPTQIVAETLEDLIPQMMRCSVEECKIIGFS
jgi:hypothetical protein